MAPARPLVSVVTPVLNRRDTLELCLDSVAAQRHPAVEHIVVDGGSTDGTVELLEDRAQRGDLRYVSGPDEGMYDAINTGMRMASGDVLAYLNSDDAWFPWTLEVAVAALRRADLVYGDLLRIDRHPGGTSSLVLQFYRDFDLTHYTHAETLAQPTVVWRREVTDRIGLFDDSYRLLGDCEYWLRAATSGMHLQHVDEVLAVQIDHAGTLRVTQEQRMREEFRRLRDAYREAAGPPRDPRRDHAERSLRWRWSQLRLRREMARTAPRRWPEFIAFLREHGVEANPRGLLLYQLPERLRPRDLAWLDPTRFEAGLHTAVAGTTP